MKRQNEATSEINLGRELSITILEKLAKTKILIIYIPMWTETC